MRPPVDANSLAHEGRIDQVAMVDDELFVTGSDNGSLALWSTQKKKPLFVLPLAHGLDPPLDLTATSAERTPDPRRVTAPPPQPRWITALRAIPYSDVVLSGSWDGCIRVFKISDDKRRIEPVGILGAAPAAAAKTTDTPSKGGGDDDDDDDALATSNGVNGSHVSSKSKSKSSPGNQGEAGGRFVIRGVVNGISTFERGERGKDGLCVVVAVGKEHRLGRWKHVPGGRNGAVIFEVPRLARTMTNGHHSPAVNGIEG